MFIKKSAQRSKIVAIFAIILIAVFSWQAAGAAQLASPEAVLASLTQKKLIPNDAPGDYQGFSVAISEGSRTAIMGAYAADDEYTEDTGAVFIFTLPDNNWGADWQQHARLVPSDGATGDRFGISVGMSDDGNTVVVGADRADANGHPDQGAAYIFTRTDGVWTQRAKLTHTTGVDSARLGWSVAISPDGNTVLLGAYQADIAGYEDQGAGHVFVRSGESWSYQVSLTLNTEGNYMGYSVSLSEDGNIALLGAPGYNGAAGNDQGMAAVFKRTGTSWAYQVGLTASDGAAGDWFGRSVSLNDNGEGALVGASMATVSGRAEQGAAYLFLKGLSGWAQEKKFTAATGEAYDHLGVSVSLGDDSEVVMVGAYMADMNGNDDSGAVYFQEKHSGIWGDPFWYNPGTSAGSRFGVSVALGWGDGWASIVGADQEDTTGYNHPPTMLGEIQGTTDGNIDQGAAFVISQAADPEWSLRDALLGSNDAYAHYGYATALNSSGFWAMVGAPDTDVDGMDDQGAVYMSTYVAGVGYVQDTRLTVVSTHSDALYGTSVDISDDGLTFIVGAPGAYVGAVNQGAAYVYIRSGSDWVLQDTLTHTGASGDEFGHAVALSGDGNIAVIGAPMVDNGGDGNVGKVFIYTRSAGVWTQTGSFARPLNAGAQYGKALAINSEGDQILVGTRETVSGHANQGAVHHYYYSGGWNYGGAITSLDGAANDYFGTSISMNDVGTFAVISAPSKQIGGVTQGQAYFFTRSGASWTLRQMMSEGGSNASFGQSVMIDNDGEVVLIGAPGVDIEEVDNLGTAYYYKYTPGGWALYSILTAMDGSEFAGFGYSVSVMDEGTRVLIGANKADWGGLQEPGMVYYFTGGFANGRIYLPLLKRQ